MTAQSDATSAVTRVEALLARVAAGMTDEQDADWLREQLFPSSQKVILQAYWVLTSHTQAARESLSLEGRRFLAAQLVSDDPVLRGRERDMERGTFWLVALAIVVVAALAVTGRL